MAVPLVHCRVRGQAIEITLSLDVVHPYTLSAFNHYVQRMVVMRSVLLFQLDEFVGSSHEFYSLRQISSPHRATSSAAPSAHTAHSSLGENIAPPDRHPPSCPVPPFAAADAGSSHPATFSAVRSSRYRTVANAQPHDAGPDGSDHLR